ncbi:MAG: hypothetical protein COA99_02885 [Moraxellaceae bacterium]|nr:MAG: hypothetical protein COA99_02885 [Moraxellaceae bacterium]
MNEFFRRQVRIFTILVSLFLCACAHQQLPAPVTVSEVEHFVGGHNTGTFINDDGYRIYGQTWIPAGEQKAIILLVHGTALHSGTYAHVGKYLASHGYIVHGTDLQGWGRSEGKASKGYIESYDEYTQDLERVSADLRNKYPKLRLYGMGESLGAGVLMYGYLKNTLSFDGFLFSGPAFKPNPALLGIRAPEFLNSINMSLVAGWGNIFPGWPLIPTDLGLKMTIKDPVIQEQLINDPNNTHTWLPACYVTAMVKAMGYLDKNIAKIRIPLYISHGEEDNLIPPSSSQEIYDRVSTNDKVLNIHKGMYHATWLEAGRFEILADMKNWLDNHYQ